MSCGWSLSQNWTHFVAVGAEVGSGNLVFSIEWLCPGTFYKIVFCVCHCHLVLEHTRQSGGPRSQAWGRQQAHAIRWDVGGGGGQWNGDS